MPETFGQRGETLAAEHDMCMGKAGIRQSEVVQEVIERLPGDADPQAAAVGEVRQTELTRRMGLAEHELALRSVQRAPLAHTALRGAAHAAPEFGMLADQFLEYPHAAQVGSLLKHRNDLLVEDPGERVRSAPAALLLLSGRWARIALDPVRRGGAESRLGGGYPRAIVLSKVHVMVIGYLSAWHRVPPR